MMRAILLSRWTLGFCFVLGLALAGSDGPFFPWPNLIGILVFCYIPIACRIIEKLNRSGCIEYRTVNNNGRIKEYRRQVLTIRILRRQFPVLKGGWVHI